MWLEDYISVSNIPLTSKHFTVVIAEHSATIEESTCESEVSEWHLTSLLTVLPMTAVQYQLPEPQFIVDCGETWTYTYQLLDSVGLVVDLSTYGTFSTETLTFESNQLSLESEIEHTFEVTATLSDGLAT